MLTVLKVYILVAQTRESVTLGQGLQIDVGFEGETQALMRAVAVVDFVQGTVKERKGYWAVARELLTVVKPVESSV